MLAELERLTEKLGSPPTQSQMTQHGRFSFKAYQNHFGSWNQALDAASLDLNKEKWLTIEDLVEELERLADELGRTPTSRDMDARGRYSSSAYSRKFEAWNAAIQQAGLELGRQREIPREDLVDAMHGLVDDIGHLPTHTQMDQQGEYSANTYAREFGSWNEALKYAFGEVNRQRNIDKSDLLDELLRLESNVSRVPTAVDMANHGKFGTSTVVGEFGSWNEALSEAGFELNQYRETPRSALISELQRLAGELGRTPKAKDMERDGSFGWATYKTQFGSWNDALREANLEVTSRTDIPEKDLKAELKRLRDELGHTPGWREMDEYGKFGGTTYRTSFGSWNEALLAVGMEPNRTIHSDNLDHLVRSRWELTIANLLCQHGVEYDYESLEIGYGDERTYTPDFITDNYVIEVKGRIYGNEHQKAVNCSVDRKTASVLRN
jgi:hypothetical protein